MDKYYKTGEFAKMANLSIRTIRYYDKIILDGFNSPILS